jgi:hypothetical protein
MLEEMRRRPLKFRKLEDFLKARRLSEGAFCEGMRSNLNARQNAILDDFQRRISVGLSSHESFGRKPQAAWLP